MGSGRWEGTASPACPSHCRGLDRNNKETSTNLHGPAILTVSQEGAWTVSHPPLPWTVSQPPLPWDELAQ